jgi:hypothetical protein
MLVDATNRPIFDDEDGDKDITPTNSDKTAPKVKDNGSSKNTSNNTTTTANMIDLDSILSGGNSYGN